MKILRCTDLICLYKILHKRHHLKAGSGIQSSCRLIKKENSWASDKPAGYTHTAFLPATDALSYGCSNQAFSLIPDSKGIDKGSDALSTLSLCDRTSLNISINCSAYEEWEEGDPQKKRQYLGSESFAAK